MLDDLEIFRARVREAIGENVSDFARRAGVSASKARTIQNWKDEPLSIKPENLALIARTAGRSLAWLYGEEPPQTVIIPVLDVTAAAGAGTIADVVRAEAEFAFPTYFLEKLLGRDTASHARLESLRSKGDSMLPTIADGALLIIDRHQSDLPQPTETAKKTWRNHQASGIWVFQLGEHVRLKRLRRIDEQYVAAISDNIENYPVEVFRPGADGAFKIIGKVIWWDNRL